VKNNGIIVPHEGWWQIPGSNVDSGILLIAHWLHPDIFPDEPPNPYWSTEEADE
jgi:hypothetical protein